ncbi:MAG: 3-deoxy-D-manno-octulosonic acid transferase [Chitinophagaceae bacterium]|nr:3-deoxy-D-manno-octulosonic acid transferase [Chitinophagaceae bacterium]
MGILLYNIFLVFLKAGIHGASLFNPKAKKWVTGRKDIFNRLTSVISQHDKVIWMHCASLGEFEQGRPLIEKLRTQYSGYKILLTFFSPSGYEVQKNYKGADWVFYLPADGPRNARRFLEIVNPSLVIFVKYEFWFYYLKKIKYRKAPLLLVSALFRQDTIFFKWYGGLQRKMLSRFDHLFVQNEDSKVLLNHIGLGDICSVSGDTRFDRVIEISQKFQPIPVIEQFIGNDNAIIAGSTWREDEEVLQKVFSSIGNSSLKLIIAPHEIDEAHIDELKKLFPGCTLFSALSTGNKQPATSNILIIDNIGMLSRLYHYGYITFVGGSFRRSGVHNVLEAAVHGKPVLYGPVYEKYSEAIELIRSGGGICVNNAGEFSATIQRLLSNQVFYKDCAACSHHYVWKNKGATEKIIQFIQEKRLLTI